MADRIVELHTELEQITTRLAVRAREDLAGAILPGQSYDAAVTSSGGTSATEAHGLAEAQGQHLPGEYQAIERGLQNALDHLQRLERRLTPEATHRQCPTVAPDRTSGEMIRCTGEVTHDGRCEQCDRDWRSSRGVRIPADVIKARNDRRPRWCQCTCCYDADGMTTCRDKAAPGRRVSERCRKRMQRAKGDT